MEPLKDIFVSFAFEEPIKRVVFLHSLLSINKEFYNDVSTRCMRDMKLDKKLGIYFQERGFISTHYIAYIRYLSFMYIKGEYDQSYMVYNTYLFYNHGDGHNLTLDTKYMKHIFPSYYHVKKYDLYEIIPSYIDIPTVCSICNSNIGVIDKSYIIGNSYYEYEPRCAYGCCIRCSCGFDNYNIKLCEEIYEGSWYEHKAYTWIYDINCKKCGVNMTNK